MYEKLFDIYSTCSNPYINLYNLKLSTMTSAYSYQSGNVQKTWILLFLFVGIVSALFYILGLYTGNSSFALIGFVISIGQAVFAYFGGEKMALLSAGAKEITYEDSPQLFEMVTNLSRIAGIPVPKIHISPDLSANAFACGRDPKHASICFNQGILDLLDKNELEGVAAHELSHVKNRDTLVMTVAMVLSSVISFIADSGMRMMMWGGMRGEDDDNNGGSNPVIMILFVISIILAPFVSMLIQMAISRQREFLADASGVVLTRYPQGLISALNKLYSSPVPTSHYSTSTCHFYISPPKREWGEKMQSFFSTHPSIAERTERLEQMG
jgi:heat shock protein HtpX